MIVDDNEDIRRGLRILFRAHDYDTVLAGDAVTAISQAKSENPDLILASIPVIVFTARDEEGHRERALEAGAKAFFQKPVDHAELLSAIDQILNGPSSMYPSLV